MKERFLTGDRRKDAEALLGEKLGLALTDHVRLEHPFNFYPSLGDGGEYRFGTTSALDAHISSSLSFNPAFTSRHLSRPLPGRPASEFILATGLGINF